jgi:hypothetical protein
MQCKRCGGSTMTETVIKLRRSVLGLRETRSLGAYCPMCQVGMPIENHPAVAYQGNALAPRLRRSVRAFWPFRRPVGIFGPGRRRLVAMPAAEPLSLAR